MYSKDTLGDDFRDVRETVFQVTRGASLHMRRSGNVEAVASGAQPTHLAVKLGNTLSQFNQDTYTPVQLAAEKNADEARAIGRENKSGNVPPTAPVSESQLAAKPSLRKKANG